MGRLTHGDETAWIDFTGAHALQHSIFDVAIRRAGGAPYPVFPLGTTGRATWLMGEEPEEYPWLPSDDWMNAHQMMHQGMSDSLLIAGPSDFTAYDLTDPDEFQSWTWVHALEHTRIWQAIGI